MSLALDGGALTCGGGLHSSIKVVDRDPDEWIDASCRLAGRALTAEEWVNRVCPRVVVVRPGLASSVRRELFQLGKHVVHEVPGGIVVANVGSDHLGALGLGDRTQLGLELLINGSASDHGEEPILCRDRGKRLSAGKWGA